MRIAKNDFIDLQFKVFWHHEVQSLTAADKQTIKCMQAFEETHASEQAKSYMVLGWKDFYRGDAF